MTIRELQDWVDQDWRKTSTPTLEAQLLFVMEELGEVAEAIRKKTLHGDYKIDDDKLGNEFGDLLITVVTLANHFDIDLTESIRDFQDKMTSRRDSANLQ